LISGVDFCNAFWIGNDDYLETTPKAALVDMDFGVVFLMIQL
jgi:hypothetical protein